MKLKLTWLMTLFMAFVMQFSFAQEKTVTGTVTTLDDGLPLPGASVIVKGTTTGVQTDFDGKYTIKTKEGEVLVFSYVGMKTTELTVGSSNILDVAFESDNTLDEVVILGSVFDIGKERENGVSSIGATELKNVVGPVSIDRAMQGQMSGVNVVAVSAAPGSSAVVSIRGALSPSPSAANGIQGPLYVVDGTYLSAADIPSINSANIESMQVLTDASQTALYGSRGANGVVVITTKKGKKGKARITLNTRYGFTERFPIRVDLMNSRQKLNYENGLSQVLGAGGAPVGLGRPRTAAEINQAAQTDVDWGDVLLKRGVTASYNLAISSGTENTSNRFSLGYDSDTGIVNGYNGFQRISAAIGNSTKVSDKFNFGYNLNGTYSKRDTPRDRQNVQSPFWSEIYNNPYAPVFVQDENGEDEFNISGELNSFGYQVLDEIFGTDAETRSLRMFGSAFAEYFILKDLKVRTQFGGTYNRTQFESFLKPSARLNSFIGTNGTKTDISNDIFDYNWRNELTYGKSFGKHDVKATLATEYQNRNGYRLELNSRDYPNDFQNVQELAGLIDQDSNTTRFGVSRAGILGVLNYSYDNKYNFNGYVRRDGSSLAGFDNQYGTFYGASVSWDIAKEGFMSSLSGVNRLLLSASYGTVGDDSVLSLYSNFTSIGATGSLGADPAALPNQFIANPQATWESNEKLNVGVAFELFQGSRLRGKVDYFQDKRTGFLFEQPLPVEAGSFSSFINQGDSRTRGLEVDLNYDVFRNPDGFNLTLFGNVTFLDAEITDLVEEQSIRGFSGGQVVSEVGLEPFTYFMVRYAGVNEANGDPLYLDVDGNLTSTYRTSDAVAIDGKSPLADLFGGFGLSSSFKGFDLSANFNFSYGNYIYNQQSRTLHDPANWRNNRVVGADNYWREPGDKNVLAKPSVQGIESNTTQFLQDASYLAFRNLSFGYTFGSNVLSGTGLDSVRAYCQLQNLAIWSEFDGNPEVGVGSSENAATISGTTYINGYPQAKSFSFGFDINF